MKRTLAAAGALVGVFLSAMSPGLVSARTAAHGISAFGDLKYPADFKNFDYVNPDAPRGGRLSLIGTGGRITFDSFNGFILKGDPAQGLELLFDTLMTRANDEPDAMYGLVARAAEIADDGRSATFYLRPEARFADGSPLTADDVVFSFTILKEKGHPSFRLALRDVVKAEAVDSATVRYQFSGALTRDLPLAVAGLPIFSKAYYATREFESTTLEPPVGSGPYKIADFRQGSFVTYGRRPDYWAKDLNVNRGRFNFDEVRYEYFRDRTAALEALKAGDYDLREEFTAKDWATAYDVPQVRDGRLVLLTLPDERPSGAQGFFINTRRAKFQDVRVRRALNLAFDFEWTNKNIFYDLYRRTASYFENSELKASAPPSADELALLEPYRAHVPAEVFGEPFVPPVSDGSGSDRRLLREAARLLTEAGFALKNGKRVSPTGEPLEIEFLIAEPSFERVLQPYIGNLQKIGIAASIRRVDPAQYERRVKSFDFDVVTQRFVMRSTPGVELKSYLSSEAARMDGSLNLAAVADPAVDGLIERILQARSRSELTTAARALDRVIRAGHYWVPHWYKAAHTIAHWNRFARPSTKPRYADGVIDTWWFDSQRAAQLKT